MLSIADLEREATTKLPKPYAEFFNDGATDTTTATGIRPRVLVKIPEIDTSAVLFGAKLTAPLGFAPTALHRLAHLDGKIATSRAAARMGVAMAVSSYASTTLEDIVAQGTGENPYAIQVGITKERGYTVQIIKRAEAAGYKAIFLTVDYPILGIRYNELRNELALPVGITYPNLSDKPLGDGFPDLVYDSNISWPDAISWLRSLTTMEIWVKGFYTPEDVILAIQQQVDGIIVPIAIDGGIRRGSDIFKALALGAQYCFLGRVPIWGVAYAGQEGVELAVQILLHELRVTMALAGCNDINEISRTHLAVDDSIRVLCRL
ncbi:FMN-dependent dehydrogenase [Aspergillus japonicus CBS 114.51]|uniref:FMN-dependent dehydrogenase n=1 Tax=Aspergillus japonicus CBS 114.51 TaxID=1448312 RepID=A0A8T8XEL3_ASPJA|nr:FMN-dependent dehydrogenase [Aspergillus japonicus CBS 114.51]RAH86757.1 FMN-dependent dehydrogenase [Aspergillus japonicus CBS 114.51]